MQLPMTKKPFVIFLNALVTDYLNDLVLFLYSIIRDHLAIQFIFLELSLSDLIHPNLLR